MKESNFLPLRRCGIAEHQGEAWFGRTAFLQALRSQIALEPRQLKISDKTVKTHLHNIYIKLHEGGRYKAFLSNGRARPAPVSARRGLLPPSYVAGDLGIGV